MKNRTLVYVSCNAYSIKLKTVSHFRKSPQGFRILRESLEELKTKGEIIINDRQSFAVLCRGIRFGTLEITITWLGKNEDNVSGYQETIVLPCDELREHLYKSEKEGCLVKWKTLSLYNTVKQPQFVFKSQRNLQEILKNDIVRRKLIRFLRDGFMWPFAKKIEFYDDFLPYSFVFKEIGIRGNTITGGLILQEQEDIQAAHYEIHT